MNLRVVACGILLLLFAASIESACVRDVAKAESEDPGRNCRKACNVDADCSSPNKTCSCDGDCGTSCFNRDAECPEPAKIENGVVKTTRGLKYGMKAKYTCNDGYGLVGVAERTCRSDKKWTQSAPTCERMCPFLRTRGEAYALADAGDVFTAGTKLKYQCRTGYFNKTSEESFTLTCQNDFTWSSVTFLCAKVPCTSHPGYVTNGDFSGKKESWVFGDKVTYFCLKGHTVRGSTNRRCQADGQWFGGPPTCDPVTCPAPGKLVNGKVDTSSAESFEYRKFIYYSCSEGYKLIGPKNGRCNENRTWGEVPKCEVEANCNFDESKPCGYTTNGTFRYILSDNGPLGFTSMILNGRGSLISMSYPIGDEKKCLKFDFKKSDSGEEPSVIGISPRGEEKTLQGASAERPGSDWHMFEVLVGELNEPDNSVSWKIEMKTSTSLDNVFLEDEGQCALAPVVTTPQPVTPIRDTTPISSEETTAVAPVVTMPEQPAEELTTIVTSSVSRTTVISLSSPGATTPEVPGGRESDGQTQPVPTKPSINAENESTTEGGVVIRDDLSTGWKIGIFVIAFVAALLIILLLYKVYQHSLSKKEKSQLVTLGSNRDEAIHAEDKLVPASSTNM